MIPKITILFPTPIKQGFTAMRILAFLSVLLIAGCSSFPDFKADKDDQLLTLKAASFNDLPGWPRVSPDTLSAFDRSCARILNKDDSAPFGPLEAAGRYGDWKPACQALASVDRSNGQDMSNFFEIYFTPYQVRAGSKAEGLFTGYYEASLRGSFERQGPYQIPLHLRPDDLVMVQLGDFRDDLKGRRIAGRVVSGKLQPYESREQIVSGAWPHNDKTLVWVDSAVDAFFVQIQGSGIVQMDDGTALRIGYAGQNGHPYYAIGRELIKRGALTKENVSMQSIRAWLQDNPDKAAEVMNSNKSYVFFRALDGEGPIGGEGLPLTPGYSLAVDRSLLPYGAPLWVDINYPTALADRIQRVMIAQDTGGAIRGPVRGDVFWGYGARAEAYAGAMKSQGRYWIMLPKTSAR